MLSKSQIKIITSLKQKKYRNKYGLFVVEGKKSVLEFINTKFVLSYLFYTDPLVTFKTDKEVLISENEMKKISFLKKPSNVLAVFKMNTKKDPLKNNGLILVLDNIKDPGNFGTIIRLCDWFGVSQLVCSLETVDCYNEKVIQASMGSLVRVSIVYIELNNYLINNTLPVFAAIMNGKNIYKHTLPKNAIIVMGNEANGISKNNIKLIKNTLSIPKFGNLQQTESLNVATATAVVLSEFRRCF